MIKSSWNKTTQGRRDVYRYVSCEIKFKSEAGIKDIKCNLSCSKDDARHSKVIKFNGFSYLFDFPFGFLLLVCGWRSHFDLCEMRTIRAECARETERKTNKQQRLFAGKTSFPRLFKASESRSKTILTINRKSPLMAVMDWISFVSAVGRMVHEWIKCCFLAIGLWSLTRLASPWRLRGKFAKWNDDEVIGT